MTINNNRTRMVWPDNYYVTYNYDILSRRSKLRFAGNESNRSSYTYEADNDLDVLTQLMNATTVTLDYGRNNAGQITSIAANDDFYLPKPTTGFSHAYVPDKLNRYSSVGEAVPGQRSLECALFLDFGFQKSILLNHEDHG